MIPVIDAVGEPVLFFISLQNLESDMATMTKISPVSTKNTGSRMIWGMKCSKTIAPSGIVRFPVAPSKIKKSTTGNKRSNGRYFGLRNAFPRNAGLA